MATTFTSRLKKAWNIIVGNKDPTYREDIGYSYSYRPDRVRFGRAADRSIVNSLFNRIAIDASAIEIRHCILDKNGRFLEEKNSDLNQCLSLEANLDQTGRALIQDVVMSMLEEGCVGILPTYTSKNVNMTESYDIYELRTAKILEWFPKHVRVSVYDDRTGRREEIVVAKRNIAIIENPLYSVVNEPNSTMQRLIRKLALLDVTDEEAASGKLDLIIQLPYTIKTDLKEKQAEKRRKDIEMQLVGSKYGIAYIDGTEKITQLNRPIENNLMSQVEYLTNLVFSQIGMTQAILDGTADESAMLNYYSRTIEPIVSAISEEIMRKFLSKTARTQGQAICFFRDPFKLVPVSSIAEIADKFTRNEIMTSNEIRQVIGLNPSDDPKADMLINSNLNQPEEEINSKEEILDEGGNNQNGNS